MRIVISTVVDWYYAEYIVLDSVMIVCLYLSTVQIHSQTTDITANSYISMECL